MGVCLSMYMYYTKGKRKFDILGVLYIGSMLFNQKIAYIFLLYTDLNLSIMQQTHNCNKYIDRKTKIDAPSSSIEMTKKSIIVICAHQNYKL